MFSPRPILALAAVVALVAAHAVAARDLEIRTRLYALDAAANVAVRIEPDSGPPVGSPAIRLLSAPVSFRWGQAALELSADSVKWSSGEQLPAGIKLVADAVLPVGPTGHAQLRCVAPVQYMERQPEGTFALRAIEADSPEVPRYVLTFQADRQGSPALALAVDFRSEIAVARSRAQIEGVQIPIGKPLVDVFKDERRFSVRRGEWQALLIRAPAPVETSVLVLFNVDDASASRRGDAESVGAQGGTRAPATAGNRTTVEFTDPDRFTDFRDSILGTASGQKFYIATIRESVEAAARRLLPPGQHLTIIFTDIDLAGAFTADAPRTYDRRVFEDYFAPPRMKFTYTLSYTGGAVIKQGSEDISVGAYTRASFSANDPEIVYDLAMLRDWMEQALR